MAREETKTKRDDDGQADDGSPITVGGGGGLDDNRKILEVPTYCDFDEAFYTDQTGGGPKRKRFAHAGSYARSLTIEVNGVVTNFSSILPNCEIEIKCPGINNDVTITGNPLGIELHTGTYRDPAPGAHRRNGNSSANEMEIRVAGFVIKRRLQPEDIFKVTVNYVP